MIIKRLFDFCFSLAGLIITLPLFIVIAVVIKITMPGTIFFTQKRVGQFGNLFTILKLRTMTMNHHGSSISIKGENRITPFGAVLRKYKLDEIPGLWNILKGEMSFVGPRPDVPGYADQLMGDDRRILEIRPGLTGPASMKYSNEEELLALQEDPIKFNNEEIFPDKVRINKAYLENWSFWLDIKIIIYTLLGKKLNEPWAQ